MLRERIDEYLDGLLNPAGVRELEATLATDPKAAKLLSQMKAERALRTAAYESYRPTPVEASTMAMRLMDEAYHTPVGRVGHWIRHGSAVAAAVLVVAGSFLAGQMTAPMRVVTITQTPETRVVYRGVIEESRGTRQVSNDLSTPEELDAYFKSRGSPNAVVVGDVRGKGHF